MNSPPGQHAAISDATLASSRDPGSRMRSSGMVRINSGCGGKADSHANGWGDNHWIYSRLAVQTFFHFSTACGSKCGADDAMSRSNKGAASGELADGVTRLLRGNKADCAFD